MIKGSKVQIYKGTKWNNRIIEHSNCEIVMNYGLWVISSTRDT